MKKTTLLDDQLNRLLKLKQTGASWLRIERETGIPRRIAKRAYEDWQKEQSFAELKESRREVAAEALKEHVELLIRVGTHLAMDLEMPRVPSRETPSGAEIVDALWQGSVLGGVQGQLPPLVPGNPIGRQRSSLIRQEGMLFESLKTHTRDDSVWDVLARWENLWDGCKEQYADLEKAAAEVVQNFIDQEKGLDSKIKASAGKDAVAKIVAAVAETIWWQIMDVKIETGTGFFEVAKGPVDRSFVKATVAGNTIIAFKDGNVADRAAIIGNRSGNNVLLTRSQEIGTLSKNVSGLRQANEQIADRLNPLVLRPIILRTRCDLCPA